MFGKRLAIKVAIPDQATEDTVRREKYVRRIGVQVFRLQARHGASGDLVADHLNISDQSADTDPVEHAVDTTIGHLNARRSFPTRGAGYHHAIGFGVHGRNAAIAHPERLSWKVWDHVLNRHGHTEHAGEQVELTQLHTAGVA